MALSYNYNYNLPEWVRVEQVVTHATLSHGLRIGLRGYDGDVTLFSVDDGIEVVKAPGRSDRCGLSQRQILEHVIETATKQLAILALEEK